MGRGFLSNMRDEVIFYRWGKVEVGRFEVGGELRQELQWDLGRGDRIASCTGTVIFGCGHLPPQTHTDKSSLVAIYFNNGSSFICCCGI